MIKAAEGSDVPRYHLNSQPFIAFVGGSRTTTGTAVSAPINPYMRLPSVGTGSMYLPQTG